MLLVLVLTTLLTPSKLEVRTPTPALRVRRAVLIPGMEAVAVKR